MNDLQAKLEISRQKRVVSKALGGLESERLTVGYSWELLERYFDYVYSIGFDDGRKRSGHGKPVAQMRDGKIIDIFPDAAEADRAMKKSKGTVTKCITSGGKTSSGFQWMYIYDEKQRLLKMK